MNKEKAQAKLADLEKEVAALKEIINRPDVPTYEDVVKKIKPTWIKETSHINALCCVWERDFAYQSEQTAIREALRAKWLNISAYVNSDGGKLEMWTHYWENTDQVKYCVRFCYEYKKCYIDEFCYTQYDGTVYFKSKEAASLALQIMGEDEWKKMNGII